MLHRAAGRGLPHPRDSGIVFPVRAHLDRLLLHERAADRPLLQKQLQRRCGVAKPDLHADESHPHRRMGNPLPGHVHLDIFHHADGCCQLCWRDQLGPPRVYGRLYRLVSKVVPAAHRPRIEACSKQNMGQDPKRPRRIRARSHPSPKRECVSRSDVGSLGTQHQHAVPSFG